LAILIPSNISPNNIAIDASLANTFSWKEDGDRQYSFQIQIYNNVTSALVFDTTKLTSFNNFYVLASNSLTNGIQYKYKVTVWNSANESQTSAFILVKASSTPTCAFTNLSTNILNSSYTFQGSFSQAQSVAIKSWQMILYNQYSEIIGNSGLIYSSTISYEFVGLENNNDYFIELQVYSQDNLLATTGKQPFHVQFSVPKAFLALTAETVQEKAAVALAWHVAQIIGTSTSSTYIGGEKLDVTGGKIVYFDNGFNINNDFTLKVWLESITNYNYNINTNSSISSYNVAPSNTTILWLDNSSQSTILPLNVARGNTAPTSANYLWLEDTSVSTTTNLNVVVDVYAPTDVNSLWLDLGDGIGGNLNIIDLKNTSGDDISVRYFNNGFYLYKNNSLVTSVSISSSKYYLYIQQIGDTLNLHAEAN